MQTLECVLWHSGHKCEVVFDQGGSLKRGTTVLDSIPLLDISIMCISQNEIMYAPFGRLVLQVQAKTTIEWYQGFIYV